MPTCQPTNLPTCQPANLPTYQPTLHRIRGEEPSNL
ncbi:MULTISPECIES: PT domain-containing protein [unclassified Moorena]|nr:MULTISPECIES: PT domain-containing protein [unclassified Moorena]